MKQLRFLGTLASLVFAGTAIVLLPLEPDIV